MEDDGPKCPNEDCREGLALNKKGEFPKFCPECDEPTGLNRDDKRRCPNIECNELLKKNKRGVYPKHCPECGSSTDPEPEKELARLCPNVDCNGKLIKNRKRLYPKHCPDCDELIDHRTDVTTNLSADLKGGDGKLRGEPVNATGQPGSLTSVPQGLSKPMVNSSDFSPAAGDFSKSLSDDIAVTPSGQHTTKPVTQEIAPGTDEIYNDDQSDAQAGDTHFSSAELLICPLDGCRAERKRSKEGQLSKFCRKCRLSFLDYVVSEDGMCNADNDARKVTMRSGVDSMALVTQLPASNIEVPGKDIYMTDDSMSQTPEVTDKRGDETIGSIESGDRAPKPTKRTAEDMCNAIQEPDGSDIHADQSPVYKNPKTPDREMADLSIHTSEKVEVSQKQQSGVILAASGHLTSPADLRTEDEDEAMDDDSSSDNEMYVTPPESDDEMTKNEDKVPNTDVSRSKSSHLLEPYLPQPDGGPDSHVKKTPTPVLVLRPSNNQSGSAIEVSVSKGNGNELTHNGSESESSTQSKESSISSPVPFLSTKHSSAPEKLKTNKSAVDSKDFGDNNDKNTNENNNPAYECSDKTFSSMDLTKDGQKNSFTQETKGDLKTHDAEESGVDPKIDKSSPHPANTKSDNQGSTNEIHEGTATYVSNGSDSADRDTHDGRSGELLTSDNDKEEKGKTADEPMDNAITEGQQQSSPESQPECDAGATSKTWFQSQHGTGNDPAGRLFGAPSPPVAPLDSGGKTEDDLRPGHTEQEPVQETGEHQNMDSTSELKEQIMDSSGNVADRTRSKLAADNEHPRPEDGDNKAKFDDEGIISIFKEYKSTAEYVKSMQIENYVVDNALAEAKRLLSTYEGHRNQSNDEEFWRTKQSYHDCINSFRNFINKNGKKLNKIFSENCFREVEVSEVPSGADNKKMKARDQPPKKQRESSVRKITFKVVLAEIIKQHFADIGKSPVVEIYGNDLRGFSSDWKPLVTMRNSGGEIWTGVWQTSCSLSTFEYKYFIHGDGQANNADAFEWLGKTDYPKTIINRSLNMSGITCDTTVYDGVIMMKKESPLWKRAFSKFSALFKTDVSTKEHHSEVGVSAMLPDLVLGLRDGADLQEMTAQITKVINRQTEHMNGYPGRYFYYEYEKNKNNRETQATLKKVFDMYIQKCVDALEQMRQQSDDATLLLRLLCGTLWLTSLMFNARPYLKDNTKVVSRCLMQTMQKIGLLQLDPQSITMGDNEQTQRLSLMVSVLRHTADVLAAAGEQSWILLVPLIHMMTGSTSIESRPDDRHTPEWWGVTEVKHEVEKQKSSHSFSYEQRWKDILTLLAPFFPHDEMLPYSLLAMLNDKQLINMMQAFEDTRIHQLPIDGILACVEYHIYQSQHLEMTKRALIQGLQQYIVVRCDNKISEHAAGIDCLGIIYHGILEVIFPYHAAKVEEIVLRSFHIYLLIMDFLVRTDDSLNVKDLGAQLLLMSERLVKAYGKSWFRHNSRVFIRKEEIKEWCFLFGCALENQGVRKWWLASCSKTLHERLEAIAAESPMAVIDMYCDHEFEIPEMDQVVADSAFARAEKLIQVGSGAQLSTSKKVGKLVDQALTKAWEAENEGTMDIVKNMVKWGNFVSVWKFFRSLTPEQQDYISDKNKERLAMSNSALDAVIAKLFNGEITFAEFDFLEGNKVKVMSLCEVSDHPKSNLKFASEAFDARKQEQDSFMTFHNALSDLWGYSKKAVKPDHHQHIEEWLRHGPEQRRFCDTVQPITIQIICPAVHDSVKEILYDLQTHKKKVIFAKLFDLQIKNATTGAFEEVVTLYEKALDQYKLIESKLETGTLSIEGLGKATRSYFDNNVTELMKELDNMLPKAKSVERKRQILLCSQLDQYTEGAKVILELKEEFLLTGDFSDMDKILESGNKKLQLKDISDALVTSAERIRDISHQPQKIKCLRTFLNCKELVDWIRKEVPKKDISNFVDLASSTLGEDDLAAQKTRYLLNALTGYSPLIYDLHDEQDGADYGKFIGFCTKVWEALETNQELIKNLEASNTELEWLKKVKTHFGNVEIKSIAQATSINEAGLYYVGNIHDYSKDFKSLEDVIQLRCRIGRRNEEKEKVYSYTQLKELQSKLTLVAGEQQMENKETIQRFETMRDTVENLARAYIDIRREGCIQFDDMLVVIHCNPTHKVAIEVRLQSIGKVMTGKRVDQDAIAHCEGIYRYMRECIGKWRESMDNNRREHIELNFFTTEQLVVLRKELGTFLEDHSPDVLPQTLPLLAMIQPVSPGQLLQFISTFNPKGGDSRLDGEQDMETGQAYLTLENMTEEQRDLIDVVLEEHEDFDEMLAVQCLNELRELAELDTMIEWIAQYKLKQRHIKEAQAQQAKVDSENSLQTSEDLMTKIMTAQHDKASLLIKLEQLWEQFIENTKQSIKNFLGIPHLAHVLEQIRNLRVTPGRPRNPPIWLQRGSPCLIPAPQSKVYQTVLTIYKCDPDYTYPTRNEVLVCNQQTTVEEVRLFMSRALNDALSIYCMVNCHLLGYDVCRYIETRLTNTADDTVKTSGLAFIYAEEKRDARIRAYLDKHLVKNMQLAEPEQLQSYVQKILTLPVDVRLSACSVDQNRTSSRLIRSARAGVGKSLKKFNLCNQLRRNKRLKGNDITIPIYKTIDTDSIIARLNTELGNGYTDTPHHTIHVDIAHEVETGADELLFNLIILRSIVNSEGVVWQSQPTQYYIIECMPYTKKDGQCSHEVMDYLPTTNCITPQQAADIYASPDKPAGFDEFDGTVLREHQWQLVIKYLDCKHRNDRLYEKEEGVFTDPLAALNLLIRNCGLDDPTWSELRHYVYFLSNQLRKVEQSPFCGPLTADLLPGFRAFVVDFMFRMAKDFATRSLRIAEETPGLNLHEAQEQGGGDFLEQLEMKRTWESGNHPYLFFNEDGETFSPLGFFVENIGGQNLLSLVDCQTKQVLVPDCMPATLKEALDRYNVPMSENFNTLLRPAKLKKLRDIMVKTVKYSREVVRPDGTRVRQEEPTFVDDDDPDPNYVLTMDNAKKILAIHQRLRVEIPVIIMGETGCGKTKLIDFMSKLQIPTALKEVVNTMIIVKIHGGTSEEDIIQKVFEAQDLAIQNQERCQQYAAEYESSQVPTVYTILFLDEANTTEAIGLVKEILCDGRIRGEPLRANTGLKIIAACNPYRRHSDEMIEKLKKAGLGYNVGEENTKDKFGQIPMRHLVYRVQALSQSLLPLVWDFGTLKSRTEDGVDVECEYITQMIKKFNQTSGGLKFGPFHTSKVANILTMTQSFMREQKDECSFVSLRDIQRLLDVANWFYKQRRYLFPAIDEVEEEVVLLDDEDDEDEEPVDGQRDYSSRSLILAIGVCYLARLEDDTRVNYAHHISGQLEELIGIEDVDGSKYLFDQIELCQNMFIREVIDKEQHVNIAMNKALKENVFMMIICIENRIPLFVVGKPGSSKSLSKAMVIDAMKGNSSKKELFKRMKRTYMVSFQCSRHATPAGIVGVFNHCAKFQEGQDLDMFVSVVVLDEVGLAEDSENMPLKTLHPLLEDGCEGNRKPEDWMKCAFVGISNWALDPAKMNRGIFVQRGTPDPNELSEIATEICRGSRDVGVMPFIDPLARGYLEICKAKKSKERDLTEFFGLRDFYSLMKMVVNFAGRTGGLNRNQLEHSIRRNFGGFDPETGFDPMNIFTQFCPTLDTLEMQADGRPPIDSIGLIESSLSGEDNLVRLYCDLCGKKMDKPYTLPCGDHYAGQCCKERIQTELGRGKRALCTANDCQADIPPGYQWTSENRIESRYLLILTENLSVLSIILDNFKSHDRQPEVVFGSKFPDDVSYTQVCHNIYRIKTCMDMGKPVILLNLDDLYESLYDALNQYFSTWGDRKFVDLGLGTHRVKTFVNENFRLVVIADKNKVHSEFPIPLINRLEKHYVSATSLLSEEQKEIKRKLEEWTRLFVKPQRQQKMCPSECDMCHEKLDKPYTLPCRKHFVGPCCKEKLQQALDNKGEGDEVKCDVKHCDTEIPADFEWRVDTVSLENRQYFENSTRETSFIGYSSETTALAVRQATCDVKSEQPRALPFDEELWQEVYDRSKFHMLLCATGESVMRLDKTELADESKAIQELYLHHQYHETLLQYLENEFSICADQSLFIQVTSFAELMSKRDMAVLKENLNNDGTQQVDVFDLYLKDFRKEDQFTDSIRSFYVKPTGYSSKLLIVQCEAADENTELLDSVRFILQREKEIAVGQVHTLLLLNLPRGRNFTGYQGGKWKCVHIDDPRSPEIKLPSLSKCMELTPSQILAKLLPPKEPEEQPNREMEDDVEGGDMEMTADEGMMDDPAAGSDVDVEMLDTGQDQPEKMEDDDDDDDGMPPLEGEENRVTIADDEYPDVEIDQTTNGDQAIPSPLPCPHTANRYSGRGQRREEDEGLMFRDLLPFILQCVPTAVSVIKADSQYDRSTLLKKILERNQDFREIFLKHVHDLLEKQEENTRSHWVKADAVKASNMKQSETMRHALEDSLERAFVPGLAAVISFIDVRKNLAMMDARGPLSNIWLEIFDQCAKLGLEVDPQTQKLPHSFKICHAGDGSQDFNTQFPFSWLAKYSIDKLIIEISGPDRSFDQVAETVSRQFITQSPIGRVIYDPRYNKLHQQLLDKYITDFVYLTHPCSSKHEHLIVGMSIMRHLQRKQIENINIVHVHLAYEEMKERFSNLSVILNLTWKDEDGSDLVTKVKDAFQKTLEDNMDCDLVALRCLLVYLSDIKISPLLTDPETWVDRVDKSKHIVSKVLDQRQEDDEIVAECRVIRSKLLLKKLFVEHVIIPTEPVLGKDRVTKRKPFKLSFLIKKVTGHYFQEFESFEQVVRWLRETVIEGVQALYERCPRQCPSCEQPLHSPVRLPCRHMICDTCLGEVTLCPEGSCGAQIPDGFKYDPTEDQIDDSKIRELKWLRKRLNKFFMAFVSEVVFGSDVEPDEDIIQWLLQCVTFRAGTRAFSLYNTADVVDPTPVLRSFILKLLMQCQQSERVQEHLNRLLAEWGDDVRQKIQTMVLLMDCRKDFYSPTVSIDDVNLTDEDVKLVTERDDVPNVDMLSSVAELQCLISYGVKALDLTIQHQLTEELKRTETTIRQFLRASAQNGNPQPGYYAARQLHAVHGESFIKDLMNTPHNYLIPDDVKRDLESFTVPDVLSVYGGQEYRAAKTAIDDVIAMSGNQEAFTNAVNHLFAACRTPWLLLEIIFTRVTRTFVQRTRVPQNVTNGLWENFNRQLQGKHHDMLGMLLRDGGLPQEMDVNSARGINLTMLVLSLLDCMSNNTAMGDLNPLSELINQPLQAANHFLPTMFDNQYELQAENIRRALQNAGENPVAYACPNGHPYYIGNCGRPAYNAVCMDCGQPIGGQGYVPAAGNTRLDGGNGAQRSRPGHILGAADQRGGAATSERDLNVLSCSVMRCLVHLCMYTGSVFYPQQVIQVVHDIQLAGNDQIRAFLEAHIQVDIQQMSRSSGESGDDCILLLHELINRMKRAARQGGNIMLTDVQQRKAWEAQFDNNYIKPTFGNNKAQRLQNIKQQLLTADNVDLRRILSVADKPIDEANILASPGLWEFKQSLTLPRVQNILATLPPENYPTMRHIVNNCEAISAVRYLPDILELMRIFSDKFHSKYKRDGASKLQIGQFIFRYQAEIPNLRRLVESFISAWNIMVTSQRMIGREFDDMEITSPLSSFLLDQHSRRFAENKPSPPFTLIIYLIDVQNRLLAINNEKTLQNLEMSSINSSYVVTIGGSEELIGVILSHSEYEMREKTRVTYNWQAIERELVMRYRTNRPILDFKPEQLQFYVFQEDFNLHNQLKSISDSQEWLSPELQASVSVKLMPRVPTLTAHLKDLKVAINFLYGTRIEGDKSLAEYMQSFARDLTYLPDSIKMRHVRDVWLLIKYAQTDLLMKHHQEPFDDIDTQSREALTPDLEGLLRDCCMYNSPRTKLLLQELFKYIILRLNKAAVAESELDANRSLDEELKAFIYASANTDSDEERSYQILDGIPNLVIEPRYKTEKPPKLLVKHAPKAWCYIWERYITKVD